MLTNNFKNLLRIIGTGGTTGNSSVALDTGVPFVDTSGSTHTFLPVGCIGSRDSYPNSALFHLGGASARNNFSASYSSGGILLGSSSDPASREDYNLHGPLTKRELSLSTSTFVYENDGGNPVIKKVISAINTSSSSVSIAEVGLFGFANGLSPDRMSYSSYLTLMDRTLLSAPVTLAPNESCSITYELTNLFEV